jgi:Golgi to ER traffic protein 4
VLFQSARELLRNGQAGSGTDLTVFLFDVYDWKGEEVSDESRGGDYGTVLRRAGYSFCWFLREDCAAYCVNWS